MVLLMPSLLSGSLVVAIAGALTLTNAWAYLQAHSFFYDTLFGPYGLQTYFWQQSAHAAAARNVFLGSPLAYYILVAVAAVAAGFIAYTLLQGLSLILSGSLLFWNELKNSAMQRHEAFKLLLARLTLRVVSLAGIAIFGVSFVSMLLPSMLLLNQTGADRIGSGDLWGWVNSIIAFVCLALSMHLLVVFVRLLFLRPRLFWGDDVIAIAEAKDQAGHQG